MTKRILRMLLASLLLTIFFPVEARASGGTYTVNLTSDSQQDLSAGDVAVVTLWITGNEDAQTTYSAYDLMVSYDAQRLTFDSAMEKADTNVRIIHTDGHIRIQGYGEAKAFSTAVLKLIFQVQAPGTAEVSISQARVDAGDNAGVRNAPAAALGQRTARFQIEGHLVVTQGDGILLPGNCYIAVPGEDFVFRLEDYPHYTYDFSVSVDGVDITNVAELDKKTGECRIPKKLVDGTIRIRVKSRKSKSFSVSFPSDHVTGKKTATYQKPYSFELKRKEGYHYNVAITIGGKEYTDYGMEGNTYTIPGGDITGKIKITVKTWKDEAPVAYVTFAGTGSKDGSGQKEPEQGIEYPFKIKRKKGYTYSLSVYGNGKQIPYEYDEALDTYYIAPDLVIGDITIRIGKIATIEVSQYITLDETSIFLIVYNGIVNEDQVPRYDGRSMYWSDCYHAYVWLVTSKDSDRKVKKAAEEKITLQEGTAAGDVDYSGNVNMTLQTDLADARLVLEMYQGKHSLEFTQMQKLLNADVWSDRKVNVRDVAAILKKIS